MEITTELIKQLRDATGVSVMQCQKALTETGGNMEEAKALLLKKSAEAASKKSDRTLGAGVVEAYVHNTHTSGALVELMCETDFVAKNEEFKTLARDIAMHITAAQPEALEDLLAQQFIKNPDVTVQNLIEQAVQKFGEKVELSKFVRYTI